MFEKHEFYPKLHEYNKTWIYERPNWSYFTYDESIITPLIKIIKEITIVDKFGSDENHAYDMTNTYSDVINCPDPILINWHSVLFTNQDAENGFNKGDWRKDSVNIWYPFVDGNGRISRCLMAHFLHQSYPNEKFNNVILAHFFTKEMKSEYDENLEYLDMTEWFLTQIIETIGKDAEIATINNDERGPYGFIER